MHVLHLHGFQRHDRLAGRDALALPDQHRDDAAVHRGANLAVAAGCRRRGRRRQRQIADGRRDATMQQIKPVAVAEESGRFRKAVAAEADAVAAQRVDLEPMLAAIAAGEIAAIALARDFQIVDAVIELDADGNRKRRRQRPPAPPRRRMSDR